MTGQNVSSIYQDTIIHHNATLNRLTNRGRLLGWLRFFSILLAAGSAWFFWGGSIILVLAVPILFTGLFLYFLSKDLNNKTAISNVQQLIRINQVEIAVLNHAFTGLPAGDELKPANHSYANDLDIFGHASLYQYINRTNSEQGNRLLAAWLLDAAAPRDIIQRQEAVKELTADHGWRQQLQACGMETKISLNVQNNVENWVKQVPSFINKKSWQVLRFVLPLISFTLLGLHISGIMPASLFYPLIFLQLLISLAVAKKVMPAYNQLNRTAPQLDSLSGCLGWIEKRNFNSEMLRHAVTDPVTGINASRKIKHLKKILDLLDARLNPLVYLPLSAFLFWDIQQVFALEKWKSSNKENVQQWFHKVAEVEALSSLATLHFNNPSWVFPRLSEEEGIFQGDKVGHPLIPAEKLVYNSFETAGLNKINIITGSNMAGKSTFLRSVGINLVLAMAGSPVCASKLVVSPMKVMSSMRISDNLEESTSTFYAELKKLKEVIDAVFAKKRVFLLLDEILRGTNSTDRHTGSAALIKQLIHHDAAGMIATHDLALASLADEFPGNIVNYHFDVQVANEELYFDYQLKRGVCTSMNASILMKKIGIEL